MGYYFYQVSKNAIRTAFFVVLLCNTAVAAVSFYPHISVGNMYTDNLDLTDENKQYDFITTLSPAIDVRMAGQSTSLSLSYSPTFASYLRFPENDTLRHNMALDVSSQISSTTLFEFNNSYLYTEDPIESTVVFDDQTDTTVRQGREPYGTNTTRIGVINQFGPEDSIEIGYEYRFLDNQDAAIDDNETHTPSITINYGLIPGLYSTESVFSYTKRTFDASEDYNDISASVRLTRHFGPHFEAYAEYTHELTNYTVAGEDYQVYSPLVGFIWDEYRNSTFSASFGYFFRNNDSSEDDSGVVGSVETRYTWNQGTSISLTGIAGYDRASFGAENLGFNSFYSVTTNIEYPLSRRLNSNLSVSYRQDSYTDETPDREDALWIAGAGITYQALPWMIVEVNYNFRKLNSNIDLNDYIENRGMIAVSLIPRQPVPVNR